MAKSITPVVTLSDNPTVELNAPPVVNPAAKVGDKVAWAFWQIGVV